MATSDIPDLHHFRGAIEAKHVIPLWRDPSVHEPNITNGFLGSKSWLDRRKLKRSGRKSSLLDDIRPERWEFTEELLKLLWVIEATLNLQPAGADLLDEVCASELFRSDELPSPSDEERKPPKNIPAVGEQGELLAGE